MVKRKLFPTALNSVDESTELYWYIAKGLCPDKLEWLCYLRKWTIEDARKRDCGAIRWGCKYGRLKSLKWLADKFELTKNDVQSLDNYAIRRGIENGHLESVKWLIERFNIDLTEKCTVHGNCVIRTCIDCGMLKTAGWFIYKYKLLCEFDQLKDIKYKDKMTIERLVYDPARKKATENEVYSYIGRRLELRQLLELSKRKHWTIADVRKTDPLYDYSALQVSMKEGNLDVVKWLISKFELTTDDVRKDGYVLYWSVCRGEYEFVKWIITTFDIPAEDAINIINTIYAVRISYSEARNLGGQEVAIFDEYQYSCFLDGQCKSIAYLIWYFGLDEDKLTFVDYDNFDENRVYKGCERKSRIKDELNKLVGQKLVKAAR